ncbi:hypothetical protein K501DRAFT_262614 [Backusella circina FSU 941]|nr:hypothetical protein K501DRAFT_262614 [Backusella circina FSU 941]
MYQLSKLPLEVLYSIFDFLEFNDLITLGRLNTWYSYKVSTTITERVIQHIQQDGWRVHMNILATSHPPRKTRSSPYVSFSSELGLLSDFIRINPVSLMLEFKLYPLNGDGMDYKEDIQDDERSLVIFKNIKTNISLVSYFAQVSHNDQHAKRLQQINQAGSAMMNNDDQLWTRLNRHGETVMMGIGLEVGYNVSNENLDIAQNKIIKFKEEYERYKNEEHQIQVKLDDPAVIEFTHMLITPDWWIQKMTNPFDDISNLNYYEHAFW